MDESFICECGNNNFWYFWGYVRCTKCHNEYKQTRTDRSFSDLDISVIRYETEYWMRRFNNNENKYNNNWEKSPVTFKNKLEKT